MIDVEIVELTGGAVAAKFLGPLLTPSLFEEPGKLFEVMVYPGQTHGWDVANRGAHTPAVDGECGRAMNVYNQFPVCRNNATTNDMRIKIEGFVRQTQSQ